MITRKPGPELHPRERNLLNITADAGSRIGAASGARPRPSHAIESRVKRVNQGPRRRTDGPASNAMQNLRSALIKSLPPGPTKRLTDITTNFKPRDAIL